MSELRDAALAYLARGWPVVPTHTVTDGRCSCPKADCTSQGKHPRVAWKRYQDALPEQGEVETWWTKWPTANIAVLTGAFSGVVVVDIDPLHGGDDSLYDLHLPDVDTETLTSRTGRGGRHFWYQHPGYEVRNRAGLRPGIDFRGDDGYVVVPPSRTTGPYLWEGTTDEPAPLPEAFRVLLRERPAKLGDPGLPSSVAGSFDLSAILAHRIPHGTRDATLTQIAGHFASHGDDLADLTLKLQGVNTLYCVTPDRKAPDPLPSSDVERIARSIWQTERAKRDETTALQAAVDERMNGQGAPAEEIADSDRLTLLRRAWVNLGGRGEGVNLMLSIGQKNAYVLVAGGQEVPLGPDLYNIRFIRMQVLAHLGHGLRPMAIKEWPKHAELLRSLTQVQEAEETRANERVEEWVTEFYHEGLPLEVAPDQRRSALRERAILVKGRLHLRPEVLKRFVEGMYGEKVELGDLRKLLTRAGWEPYSVPAGGHQVVRAWRAPV